MWGLPYVGTVPVHRVLTDRNESKNRYAKNTVLDDVRIRAKMGLWSVMGSPGLHIGIVLEKWPIIPDYGHLEIAELWAFMPRQNRWLRQKCHEVISHNLQVAKNLDPYRFDNIWCKATILNVENWGQRYNIKEIGVLTNLDLRSCADPVYSTRPFTENACVINQGRNNVM